LLCMNPETQNWLASADYDLKTARSMFRAKRYLYTVYMAHLAVEKTLKALVAEITGTAPPKTHNLIRLVDLARIEVPEDLKIFIGELNAAAGTVRYPENLNNLVAAYPGPVAGQYLKRAEKVIKWLKENEPLKR
ncbi:MAG: HEPN domain-containing protein, partial [Moorella sp. (in: Bacteria)]|nr:HEPN domain-containing protein [Moorella sp. (in: firmicutes)]